MEENLWAISIDPDESMREYVLLQLKVKAMRDLLFRSRLFTYLAAATPGLKELVTIGKIWELALDDRKVKQGRRYDTVIVDAPATGHGVGFLQTPRTFAAIARVGPMHQQANTLDAFITNPKRTGVAIVSLPEEMPVNETAKLEHDLGTEVGVGVDRIFLNGLYPETFAHAELERLAALAGDGGSDGVRAAARAAVREGRRAASQRQQLARLEELTTAPVTDASVPLRSRARHAERRSRTRWRDEDPGGHLMASVAELLDGKRICICAGSGASARRRPRPRSPPGWPPAASRSRC